MNGIIKLSLALVAVGASAGVFFKRADRTAFLPGPTTGGHHQIEEKCDACHTPFGGVAQQACLGCHADGLEADQDSHSPGKFEDPRNALQLGRIDAAHCVACHREHRPTETDRKGVSARAGFCVECHRDVGRDVPSHADIVRDSAFSTCADVGCHNFHDNRAVYGDFLAKHRNQPDLLAAPSVPARRAALVAAATVSADGAPEKPAAAAPAAAADPPAEIGDPTLRGPQLAAATTAWERSAHARAGVSCGGCHRAGGRAAEAWVWRPDPTAACARCHDDQRRTFLGGKHGMRLAAGLPPMRPADARLPMKEAARRDSHEAGLTCGRCHDAHGPDTRTAALEACEACHDDGHTRAYRQSAHFALWQAEGTGKGAPGSGVSCATCHLPRTIDRASMSVPAGMPAGSPTPTPTPTPTPEPFPYPPSASASASPSAIPSPSPPPSPTSTVARVWVDHNQNANLRPADKMARSVCMSCHGLRFSLASLASREVVDGNFAARAATARTGFDLLPRSTP